MPKSCIPGYVEELEREARLRRSAFLGLNYEICGIEIQNLTPFLLARLRTIGTTYLDGGDCTIAETLKFLWLLSPIFTKEDNIRDAFVETATKRLIELDAFDLAIQEINEFIRVTFMDATAGGDSVPYVIGEAWITYTFMKDPFNWTEEKSMHTPYRKLFQYLRCVKLENGIDNLINEFSDPKRDKWLHELRAQWNNGGNN